MSNLLSYPTNESASSSSSNDTPISVPSTSSSSSRQPLKDRLFIGNLHPSVDEYTLLQIFTKFGKVTKLDFLFHKSGALKGKPRGYAFLEYGSHNEAEKALMSANGKLLLGRKLVVTYAHHAPTDADGVIRPRKTMMETGRPTTLSMLKSSTGWKHKDGTSDKIAIMEAKLRELEASKPKANPEPGTSTLPTSSLPTHPSLPPKPPPAVPAASGSRPTAPKPHSNGPSLSLSRSSSGHSSFPNSEPPTKKLKLGTPTAP
ncbi:RNA-binding domain-containing protein [Gymnopus androsaceus JB14]|uniref:Probable RNA-binding protein 18 n=1 Tax=Gymnopus androsaceus JB14 TaxID=1447944 RepID=A0A6A4HH09_9AGAR|nr:RNA-binding domain-containing protein [Gymnopus androsaceus JB14]